MTGKRVVVAAVQRLFPPKTSSEAGLVAAMHLAFIRLEARRQERRDYRQAPSEVAIAQRLLKGYSKVQKRLLRPEELKPATYTPSAVYLALYPR